MISTFNQPGIFEPPADFSFFLAGDADGIGAEKGCWAGDAEGVGNPSVGDLGAGGGVYRGAFAGAPAIGALGAAALATTVALGST
jgi:hypothetical protein